MRGTVEPKGPIDENDILYKDLNYHYHGNSEEDYNIIVLIPKVLEDLDHNAYFIGYSRRNTTGSMPKVMKDFSCLASDIIDDIGYIPHEFIFGYQVFGSEVEEKFFINPYHISLLGDDLQRIACTKILRRNTEKLKNNLEVFNLKNIDLDVIESYKNPLIKTDRNTSMQTTAEEFFDYLNNQNVIEDKPKSMIK